MAAVDRIILYSEEALTATDTSPVKSTENYHQAFVAELVATAVNAATTLDVKVEHSADGTNWYDLVTFAQLVGSDGSEVVQVTGTPLTQLRATATLAGATQEATVTVRMNYEIRK